MKLIIPILLVLISCSFAPAQTSPCASRSPREAVDSLWKMATLGDLPTSEGRATAARDFFTSSSVVAGDSTIRVVGNDWGGPVVRTNGDTSLVDMGYSDDGQIDSRLRYTPATRGPGSTVSVFPTIEIAFRACYSWSFFEAEIRAAAEEIREKGAETKWERCAWGRTSGKTEIF
ncbi:MAG TPA: hypothetical protein VMB47_14155 [Candidatus Aquilonibacter sp.]|nr:hypothetical protein [Candidatus Aquilonibacter sp.]